MKLRKQSRNVATKLKYRKVREALQVSPRDKDDRSAYITHFLQNAESSGNPRLKEKAVSYLRDAPDLILSVAERGHQYVVPITWDVPFPPVPKSKFTFIDLFAGIGGFRLAFQKLGGRCVFSSEWDTFAKITYEMNFGEVPFGDIRLIDEQEIPDHEILLAGFPCQPFSIAGVSKKNSLGRSHGFLDMTQGTLFFDIARILRARKPAAFVLENVKNLKSHDKGKTFEIILKTLEELGYKVFNKILDSQYYVPQHRERIFLVGFLDHTVEFEFPEPSRTPQHFSSIMEANVDSKYTLTDHLWLYLQRYAEKHKAKGNGFGYGLVDTDGISRTLSARYHKDGSEILIPQKSCNPRRLTPRECARLQGYPETFKIPVSDTQAYRQFGNSVTTTLIEELGRCVIRSLRQ